MLLAMYLHRFGPIGIEGGRGLLGPENLAVQVGAIRIIYVRRHECMDMIGFMFIDRSPKATRLEFPDR